MQPESNHPPSDPALGEELDRIFAARDREDMGPTIAAFLEVLDRHPQDARVLYEVGGAYDTAGEEATAVGFYERAMGSGLGGELRRRCFLQYASTLRNLDRFDESLAVFARARTEFPDSVALRVFEALSLHAAGRVDAAFGAALTVIADEVEADDVERYRAAIRGNAEYLRSLDTAPVGGGLDTPGLVPRSGTRPAGSPLVE